MARGSPPFVVMALSAVLGLAGIVAAQAPSAPAAAAASVPDPFRPPAIFAEHVPAVPKELISRLAQYQATRSAAFLGWAPDGRGMLIATRFGETAQLHRVYERGGRREQITFEREPVGGRFLPGRKDGTLVLTMSSGGNENDQVYLLRPSDSGRPYLLTDGKSRNLLGPVTRDGRRAVIAHNGRNGRDTDLYVADLDAPGALKLIMETNGEFWDAADWSPDGTQLLLNHYVSINESHAAVFDVVTGKRTPIPNPGTEPAAFGPMAFLPGGRSILIATDARSEFRQLGKFDLKSGQWTWFDALGGGKVGEGADVADLAVDDNTGRAAVALNREGLSELFLLEPNGQTTGIPLPIGVVSGLEFSEKGDLLGFTLNRPDAPGDAYSLSIPELRLEQWTYSEAGGLDVSKFRAPDLVRYSTFDGRTIPAWVTRPADASADKPAGVIVLIHGGPEAQARPLFSGIKQFYVNELGLALIEPNVRGSAGYGKTYLKLDNALLREDSVKDIGALLDWIAAQPDLDAKRVAVMGGSYGGYMTLASLTHYSDRLKAGIDVVGIASFRSFLRNTSAYRQDLRRVEYGDERKPEVDAFFSRIDPLENAHKITAALMVAHGRNDPRVPFSEAEQIVAKVRANGREVWTVYADNEGHGFAKKPNADYLQAAIVLFLQRQLSSESAAARSP